MRAALAAHADLRFVLQEPQLGTAHAVQQAAPLFAGVAGTLVLLSGDVPLLSVDTLRALLARHEATGAAATVLTAIVDEPVRLRPHPPRRRRRRGASSNSATPRRRSAEIREINSGIYAFDLEPLFPSLAQIAPTTRRRSST